MENCKHTVLYRVYEMDHVESPIPWIEKHISYSELSDEQQQEVDEKQLTWMRCSEHCGNTVRDK